MPGRGSTDEQLLQLRSWGASHRQIGAMLGLRRNTVSVRFSRIDRARKAQATNGDSDGGGEVGSNWWSAAEAGKDGGTPPATSGVPDQSGIAPVQGAGR